MAEAEIRQAVATSQTILDAISLEVVLAYRAMTASRNRIDLSRIAVTQSKENLRLVRVKYRNGDATPTDIVDAESAQTRSQQRYFTAIYEYLSALARLEYALGGEPGSIIPPQNAEPEAPAKEQLPSPRTLPPS